MKYEIYLITNTVNQKKYIGITRNLRGRWYQHKITNGSSPYLHKAIKKYGIESFVFEHLATAFNLDFAQIIEKNLISEFGTKAPKGYNLTDGGEGVNGLEVSHETRMRLSKISKERWSDPKFSEKMLEVRHSEEYRQKQSEISKKVWSDPNNLAKIKKPKNHGEKIRALKLGKKQSAEHVANRIVKNTGKKRSEETKLRMSEANKAAWIIRKAKNLTSEKIA
jgi:group I intron endonuclease